MARPHQGGRHVSRKYDVITDEQAEQFLERGFIVLHDCFTRETANAWITRAWQRLGYDPNDPATWEKPRVQMPNANFVTWEELAPKAWAAAGDLSGGHDRLQQPCRIADGFVINFGIGKERPWQDPSADAPGWHKDGDFFRHFLDSPEQGLLTLVLWTDVRPQGGATFVAADSVAPVARFLADHPEGVHPLRDSGDPVTFDYADLLSGCTRFVEATGSAGDVYLIHPYLLHAKGQNILRRPRAITNPPIGLTEPMRFDRADPADHSPVERAVLRALGVDRYPFTPTAPRAGVVPPRVAEQERLRALEKERLAG